MWNTKLKFDKAIEEAGTQLERIRRDLKTIVCPQVASFSLNLSKLSSEYIEEKLKSCKVAPKSKTSSDYLYIIRIDDKEKSAHLCSQLKVDAKKQREDESEVGYSRINHANVPSATLYVGRSQSLKTRLRQHLGAKSIKPYALHMELWATRNDLEVTIDYMHFEDRDSLLIQAIEDGLWESLKPVFGRKGSK